MDQYFYQILWFVKYLANKLCLLILAIIILKYYRYLDVWIKFIFLENYYIIVSINLIKNSHNDNDINIWEIWLFDIR